MARDIDRKQEQSPVLEAWENEGGSPPAIEAATAGNANAAQCEADRLACIPANDRLPLGILITDAHGRCVYSNAAYQRLAGCSSRELLGSHWGSIIHPQDREGVVGRWREALRAHKPCVSETRLIRFDGAVIWIRQNIAMVNEARPESGHVHTIEDISVYKSAEAARDAAEELLFEEKERAQVTLDSIGDAVISTDVSGKVTYMNVIAEDMTGWSHARALGRPLADVFKVVESATRQPATNPAQRAIDQNRIVGLAANSVLLCPNGDEVAIEDSAAPIHNRDGMVTGAVIVFHDVKFSESSTEKMAYLAQHDSLTGLPNRSTLMDRLAQALELACRHRRRVGLLFIDLDNFKRINDTLGHAYGDHLLVDFSARLARCVRTTDTVCRYGGDEFVVLLSEIERPEDTAILARKLPELVAAPWLVDGHEATLKLSIGISIYPEDGEDAKSLLQKADAAMYQSKAAGKHSANSGG